MIRIKKPKRPPEILRTKGATAAKSLCDAYALDPGKYERGELLFNFDARIYRHASVVDALRAAQHNKCAFCESYYRHVTSEDVEHFRPKAGFRQETSDPLGRPGYYWLAYEWTNLFASCPVCNRQFKRNLFPLVNHPSGRVCSHDSRGRLRYEKRLLIDPAKDDPAAFIGYSAEIAFAINDHPRGRKTIEMLGLNREDLVERRRDRLRHFRLLLDYRRRLTSCLRTATAAEALELRAKIEELNADLERYVADAAEYAAMMRVVLADVRTDD